MRPSLTAATLFAGKTLGFLVLVALTDGCVTQDRLISESQPPPEQDPAEAAIVHALKNGKCLPIFVPPPNARSMEADPYLIFYTSRKGPNLFIDVVAQSKTQSIDRFLPHRIAAKQMTLLPNGDLQFRGNAAWMNHKTSFSHSTSEDTLVTISPEGGLSVHGPSKMILVR